MQIHQDSDSNYERLKFLLREMFQLNRGDLDFGLYRIMKLKSAEIEEFLNNGLLLRVKEVITEITSETREILEKELTKAKESAFELDLYPDDVPKIVELQR